jgi:hypothetical protein
MEKVNEIPSSPLDVFLLPVWVHKRITVKFKGLIFAFLFVGAFDFVFHRNLIKEGFFQGDTRSLILKILLGIAVSLVIGAFDVVCTIVPIAEFAIMIGNRSEKYVNAKFPVILMKSYALSHLLFLVPTAVYLYSGVDWLAVDMNSPFTIRILFAVLFAFMFLMPYLQLGFIYRTISVRTRIQVFGKLILVLATYFWMQLSGEAIAFINTQLFNLIK